MVGSIRSGVVGGSAPGTPHDRLAWGSTAGVSWYPVGKLRLARRHRVLCPRVEGEPRGRAGGTPAFPGGRNWWVRAGGAPAFPGGRNRYRRAGGAPAFLGVGTKSLCGEAVLPACRGDSGENRERGSMCIRCRRGFTLIELLVVVGVIAILAGMLLPVFAQAREKARQTTCMSHLRQIGAAIAMYRSDFDAYPPVKAGDIPWLEHAPALPGLLDAYLRVGQRLQCPSRKVAAARYTMNRWNGTHWGRTETSPQGQPDAAVSRPSSTLIVWEHQVSAADCILGQEGGDPQRPDAAAGGSHWDSAHHGGFNALWCDGRVKRMRYTDLFRTYFTIEEDPE